MERKSKIGGLRWTFLKMSVLPIFLLTLIVTVFAASSFASTMHREVENGLESLNSALAVTFDMMYPGDYSVVEDESGLYFYKGDHLLNGDFSIVDTVKERTGVEITVSCRNVRVITTLMDAQQNRLIDTRVSSTIAREVMEGQVGRFYPKVPIGGDNYYAYYAPLINSDGTSVGMLFVAKPSREVELLVRRSILPIVGVSLLFAGLMILIITLFSNRFLLVFMKIDTLLKKTANGELSVDLEPEVMKRRDELGEMGRYVVRMQHSLRELVETDQLTGLYNRRYAQRRLQQLQEKRVRDGNSFCVAIGDIDFFKKVNDTYGHECGDVVLADVAARLKELMKGRGFAARWGGEEFLLVFEYYSLEQTADALEGLLNELRGREITYRDQRVKVTMTVGAAEGSGEMIDHIIREADQKLYYGKNNGRNQVVK